MLIDQTGIIELSDADISSKQETHPFNKSQEITVRGNDEFDYERLAQSFEQRIYNELSEKLIANQNVLSRRIDSKILDLSKALFSHVDTKLGVKPKQPNQIT